MLSNRTAWLAVLIFLFLGTISAYGAQAEQRKLFKSALTALDSGEEEAFESLEVKLRGYVLYPYLEFARVEHHFVDTDAKEIHRLLARYSHLPKAKEFRKEWLRYLAGQGRWRKYIAEYRRNLGTVYECHYATALIRTGREKEGWQQTAKLWLVGKSQPSACDYPFKIWHERGRMTHYHVLRRIMLAMFADEIRFANYLKRFLPVHERPWVDRLIQMHRHPATVLAELPADTRSYWPSLLYRYGIRRLAKLDAAKALHFWKRRDEFVVSAGQRRRIERSIVLHLAFQHQPQAESQLRTLVRRTGDPLLRQWRVRTAIWHRKWREVLGMLEQLPRHQRNEREWVYWRARALEQLGKKNSARELYAGVAHCRCYYGFLAAERLGQSRRMDSIPLRVSDDQVDALRDLPAVRRATELNAVGLGTDARREWKLFVSGLSGAPRLKAAARLAQQMGWPDKVIFALGRSRYLNDLELRFPMPYPGVVDATAQRYGLEKAFVYALMRQESAFTPDAHSYVGAIGLMQLMPDTARRVAKRMALPVPGAKDLLRPRTNIRLGTAHLSELLDRYQGNWIYTLAAYNAGNHRVMRWQPDSGSVPADVWIANIAFSETRQYVERILAYARVYGWRLGHEVDLQAALTADMQPLADRQVSGSQTAEAEARRVEPGEG